MINKILLASSYAEERVEAFGNILEQYNFRVVNVENGLQVLRLLQKEKNFVCVIAENVLRGLDGFSLCKLIRANPDFHRIPFIMLNQVQETHDSILALELGADDCILKSIHPRELLARIHAIMRRTEGVSLSPYHFSSKQLVYHFANWHLDTASHNLISPQKKEIALTAKLYELLLILLENPLKAIQRDQLMEKIHQHSHDVFDRSIDILVSRLRHKLADEDPCHASLIKTIRSCGYMFTVPVEKKIN